MIFLPGVSIFRVPGSVTQPLPWQALGTRRQPPAFLQLTPGTLPGTIGPPPASLLDPHIPLEK